MRRGERVRVQSEGRQLKRMMNCEEFELLGLDIDRADADPREAAAAAQHVEGCARCSALLESWREVKGDLQLLREATRFEAAPARVEMRLKQELRTRREARVLPRRTAVIASWALAAAALLAVSVGWVRTHNQSVRPAAVPESANQVAGVTAIDSNADENETLLAADYDGGEFTQLPGSLPSESGENSIFRVRMQRGGLERFGLPVDPERASDWVDVDFLVGEDGHPQAVRLHQDSLVAAVAQ
jgi:hypothetical protein